MSKSLGGSSRAMGGGGRGGGGSGGMLRTVQRALRTSTSVGGSAAQEPFSNSSTTTTSRTIKNNNFNNTSSTSTISLASSSSFQSPFTNLNLPISVNSPAPSWASSSAYTDESDWEYCLDGIEDHERINIFFDDHILGPVPSNDEVHHAVSALQQVHEPAYFSYFNKDGVGYTSNEDTAADEVTSPISLTRQVSSNGSVSDWIEPSLHIYNSKLLQPYGSDRVYDAFHLLRTEPSIQRMVISLSSDKAVWDAVLNNEVVREMRDSLRQADNSLPGTSGEDSDKSDGTTDTFNWTFVNTKAKVMEMIDKIIEFVKEWFQPPEMEKTSEGNNYQFDEKLRTPFFLSVVVLLIVIVARAQNA